MKMDNYKTRLKTIVDDNADGKYTVFAKKAGIPHSTFQSYMQGKLPHPDHLLRIHDTYHISIDWLLFGHGKPYIDKQIIAYNFSHGSDIGELNFNYLKLVISGIEEAESDCGKLSKDDKARAIFDLYRLVVEYEGDIDKEIIYYTVRLFMQNKDLSK